MRGILAGHAINYNFASSSGFNRMYLVLLILHAIMLIFAISNIDMGETIEKILHKFLKIPN